MVPLKSCPLVGAILMERNDEWIQGRRYIGIVSAFRISYVWRFTRAVRAASTRAVGEGGHDVDSTTLRYSRVKRCCSQASPASRNSRSMRLAGVAGAWARRPAMMSRISRSDCFLRS
jgi:hypothetical protein